MQINLKIGGSGFTRCRYHKTSGLLTGGPERQEKGEREEKKT